MSVAKQRYGRVKRAADAAGIGTPKAEPKQEVIQAQPAPAAVAPKQPKVINVPSVPQVNMPQLHIPGNALSWVTLAAGLLLWYVSVMATRAFLGELFGVVSWYWPYVVQIGFSAIERYLFAGVKNWFTISVLVADAVINAAGLFIDLLPRFFKTSVWAMIQDGTGINGDLRGGALLFAAVSLGILLAWGNDNLFSLALSGKR